MSGVLTCDETASGPYTTLGPLTQVLPDSKQVRGFEDKYFSEKCCKLLFVDVSFVSWTRLWGYFEIFYRTSFHRV